jgi:hypothetical protein
MKRKKLEKLYRCTIDERLSYLQKERKKIMDEYASSTIHYIMQVRVERKLCFTSSIELTLSRRLTGRSCGDAKATVGLWVKMSQKHKTKTKIIEVILAPWTSRKL